MKSQKSIQMTEIALMSAVLCVLAPFSVPVPWSPVPLSPATFVVYLAAVLLGAKRAALSVLIYLLLGMVGLPVFSGFSGGIGVLAGPTGGYLIGYVFCAVITGTLVGRRRKPLAKEASTGRKGSQQWQQVLWNVLSMVLGTIVCYCFGTGWFLVVLSGAYSLTQALLVCVVPYLIFDVLKIFAAAAIAVPVRSVLKRIGADGR